MRHKLQITLVFEGIDKLTEAQRRKLRTAMAQTLNFNLDPTTVLGIRAPGSVYWEGVEEKL